MDENLKEIIEADPVASELYRNEPVPHFYSQSPHLPIVDIELGPEASNFNYLRSSHMQIFRLIETYEFSRIRPIKTNRGWSRKWQYKFDYLYGNKIDEPLEQDVYLPLEDLMDTETIADWFYSSIQPAADALYFPLLDLHAKPAAKKVRVTFVRDNIEVRDMFSHAFTASDDNVLLSAFVYFRANPAAQLVIKSGDKEVIHHWDRPGYGIVTAPQKHPYEYKVTTTEKDNACNGLLSYFIFDIME